MKSMRILASWTATAVLVFSVNVVALQSHDPALLGPGQVRGVAAGGISVIDRRSHFYPEAALKVGMGARLEVTAPLALGVLIIDAGEQGGLVLGGGVPDLYVSSEHKLLYPPTVAVSGKARIGREAMLLAAVDLTFLEEGFERGEHPAWIRGAVSVVIDFSTYATLAFGLAHQRIVVEGALPEDAERTGWVGDARISFGSVHSGTFTELPTLSVHLQPYFDLIMIARFDVDLHTSTTNTNWLFGVELRR
jgi:hypothetical protein